MGKEGPGLYTDFGKEATDLLYRDYPSQHKFSVTTVSPTAVAITSSVTKTGGLFLADVNTQLKNKNCTTDIKVDTKSNLFTTITVDETVPGLKTILSFRVPDQKSGKLEVQYLNDFAGISTSIGLKANPTVDFSCTLGTNGAALGTDVSFYTKSGRFTKLDAGFRFSKAWLSGSLALNDKGGSLLASYKCIINPLSNTAVGTEIYYRFANSWRTVTFGTEHDLNPMTTVKARLDEYEMVNGLIQHKWGQNSLAISAEVDIKDIRDSVRFGLELALNP